MTRHGIREHVFRLIFQNEFYEPEDIEKELEIYFQEGISGDGLAKEAAEEIGLQDIDEIRERCINIAKYSEKLDSLINEKTEKWDSSRMGRVELLCIRMALYEMEYEELPKAIAMNEAVELAKKYGQEGAGGFVNGVLSKLVAKE